MVLLPDKSIRKKSRKISSRNSLQVVPAAALHCSRRAEDQSGRSRLKPYGKGRGGRFVTRHILFHFLANLSMQKKRSEGSKATCGHASIAAGNAPPSVPAKENNIRIGHGASTAAAPISKKKKISRPQEDQYSSFPVPGENRGDRVPITQDRMYRKIFPSAETRLTASQEAGTDNSYAGTWLRTFGAPAARQIIFSAAPVAGYPAAACYFQIVSAAGLIPGIRHRSPIVSA